MSNVQLTPQVRCDNCGKTVEKVRRYSNDATMRPPSDWGSCDISPTIRGQYPNPIVMTDLCPPCLKFVHDAVTSALEEARNARPEPEATHQEKSLEELVADAQAAYELLTPEQQKAMWEEQRKSWVRGNLALGD